MLGWPNYGYVVVFMCKVEGVEELRLAMGSFVREIACDMWMGWDGEDEIYPVKRGNLRRESVAGRKLFLNLRLSERKSGLA